MVVMLCWRMLEVTDGGQAMREAWILDMRVVYEVLRRQQQKKA